MIMLNTEIIRKIESFVYQKPRSIDEIARYIGKNWRTADRYIQSIEKDYGTISTRVFREGSRGALKVVFWSSVEKASRSVFQDMLETQILNGRTKYDFSAFDIFQHVPDAKKRTRVENTTSENTTDLKDFAENLSLAKTQLIIFSGNLSSSLPPRLY